MESKNPVFARSEEFQRGGYATFDTREPSSAELEEMYGAPSATSVQTGRMTIDDVVIRTASIFAVLLVAAGITFVAKPAPIVVIGAAIAGFVLSLVITFRKAISPPLILTYGALEGVFVGGISWWFEINYEGIVAQAVLGTFAAFGSMLALYSIGAVRATPKFRRILLIAGVGYLVFALVHLLGVAFNWWDSIYAGGGGLAILVSAFGVVLASLFLVLDFDFIEQGIRNGAPQKYAWLAGFGLIVTLVWLYIEMLRLIAILRGD
jgi:uncharacterized YccA/Bax inhibitor family protein